jgi:hypothetical protein
LSTLYFSNHEPDAISAQFMELLAKCDVLVVENGSCDGTEEYRTELLNSLSSGKLTPAQLDALGDPQNMFKGFEQVLGRAVHGKNKRVVLENSPWSDYEGYRFLTFLTRPPRAGSLKEALSMMRTALNEAAALVRIRDEAYASQLSELVKANASAEILAMMGSGHQRALAHFLVEKGVAFRTVEQQSSLPSTYRSIALEKAENREVLSRLDILRCLAEFFPLRSFVPFGDRGSLFMTFWIGKRSEAELRAHLSRIYPHA